MKKNKLSKDEDLHIIKNKHSNALSYLQINSILEFGKYYVSEQKLLKKKKSYLEWYVLDIQDEKMLLASKNAIEFLPYFKTKERKRNRTWEKSTIREWLNLKFFEDAFSKKERKAIIPTKPPESKKHLAKRDMVFLLSVKEYNQYTPSYSLSNITPNVTKKYKKKLNIENLDVLMRDLTIDHNPKAFSIARKSYENDSLGISHGIYPCVWVDILKYKKSQK